MVLVGVVTCYALDPAYRQPRPLLTTDLLTCLIILLSRLTTRVRSVTIVIDHTPVCYATPLRSSGVETPPSLNTFSRSSHYLTMITMTTNYLMIVRGRSQMRWVWLWAEPRSLYTRGIDPLHLVYHKRGQNQEYIYWSNQLCVVMVVSV